MMGSRWIDIYVYMYILKRKKKVNRIRIEWRKRWNEEEGVEGFFLHGGR